MDSEWSDPELLRAIFDETRIVRKPLTGIITGYHVLPYILVAPEHEHPARAVEIRGRIKVSPRLVIAAGGDGPTYGELFGERELMDRRLVARVFSFRYASRVALESEDLAIRRHDHAADSHLDRVLDELSRREIIDTGVIVLGGDQDVRQHVVAGDDAGQRLAHDARLVEDRAQLLRIRPLGVHAPQCTRSRGGPFSVSKLTRERPRAKVTEWPTRPLPSPGP